MTNTATSPAYYKFPGDVEVRHISAHLTSFGGQGVQYFARATRLDGNNKSSTPEGCIEDLEKAKIFAGFEIDRLRAVLAAEDLEKSRVTAGTVIDQLNYELGPDPWRPANPWIAAVEPPKKVAVDILTTQTGYDELLDASEILGWDLDKMAAHCLGEFARNVIADEAQRARIATEA
ncbi:hypothetical protein ACFRAQ_34705 [Nocardia sp. NPDC056611]|uniref:hypothetical protein n=1 Tax=Nocardia sp. NPDC056611 TaxID=3345877 RepID=UPI00366C4837